MSLFILRYVSSSLARHIPRSLARLSLASGVVTLVVGPGPLAQAENFSDALHSVVRKAERVSVSMAASSNQYFWRVAGTSAGSNAELETWNGSNQQKWLIQRQSGLNYRFKLDGTSNFLATNLGADSSLNNYDNVQLSNSGNNNLQQWVVQPVGERGHIHLRSKANTAYYLQAADSDSNGWDNGDNLQVRQFLDNWNFRWTVTNLQPLDAPSITKTPSGDLLVYLREKQADGTFKGHFYRKSISATSWGKVHTTSTDIYGPTLFTHLGNTYLIYGKSGKLRIRKSTNNGNSWSDHFLKSFTYSDGSTLPISAGGGCPVLVTSDYLYYAFMDKGGTPASYPSNNRLRVASCPVTADPTDGSNWTVTSPIEFPSSPDPDLPRNRDGWTEANLVKMGSDIMMFARVDTGTGKVIAALKLSSDRQSILFNNTYPTANPRDTGFIDVPFGGSSKFHIVKDPQTSYFIIMANRHQGAGINVHPHFKYNLPSNQQWDDRNELLLYKTTDFKSFTTPIVLIQDDMGLSDQDSVNFNGFQQPAFIIDGRTVRYVSRTAYGLFDSYHEANMITYHEKGL